MEAINTLEEAKKFIEENQKKIEFYQKGRQRSLEYQKNHPEKMREKSNKHFQKIKENPEKYELYKERQRIYATKVREEKKLLKQENPVC